MSALHNDPLSCLLLAFIAALGLALCWFFIKAHIKRQAKHSLDFWQQIDDESVAWMGEARKAQLTAQQVRDLAARSAGIDIASDAAFITPNPFSPGTLNHAVWRNQYARTLDGIHTGTAQPKDAA